jgi:hypothetical protein
MLFVTATQWMLSSLIFKEFEMTDGSTTPNLGDGKISLEVLAKMTGFPLEMIQQEIFAGEETAEGVSLEDLRAAMLSYIDSTLLSDDK